MVFLQVALNGDRQHDAVPKTPEAIGAAAEASVRAGAQSVHVHAFDDTGKETLNAPECAAVVRAIRARCPGVPVSLTTSAAIIADPIERLAGVQSWTDFPDLVTANQGETGIVELSEWLISRGVEIEAGLLSPADARSFVASPLRDRCRRVLIEPLDPDPTIALRDAGDGGNPVGSAYPAPAGPSWLRWVMLGSKPASLDARPRHQDRDGGRGYPSRWSPCEGQCATCRGRTRIDQKHRLGRLNSGFRVPVSGRRMLGIRRGV